MVVEEPCAASSKPLPFRGGVGVGQCHRARCLRRLPHPNPSPEGEGLNVPHTNAAFKLPAGSGRHSSAEAA